MLNIYIRFCIFILKHLSHFHFCSIILATLIRNEQLIFVITYAICQLDTNW